MGEQPDPSKALTREEKVALKSGEGSQITLPADIKAEIEMIDNQFSESADVAIHAEYEKIGALQFLERVKKEDLSDFRRTRNLSAKSISASPIRSSDGDVMAYDVYIINQNAIQESPEAMERIRNLSFKMEQDIRSEKMRLLEAAVAQGRAEDLGEISTSNWAKLSDDVLDASVGVHLYDAAGNRLDILRVFKILN